jgi:hypothetical protein
MRVYAGLKQAERKFADNFSCRLFSRLMITYTEGPPSPPSLQMAVNPHYNGLIRGAEYPLLPMFAILNDGAFMEVQHRTHSQYTQ